MDKNISLTQSIRGKLKHWARTHNLEVEDILYRYCIERFLYRLSQSKYKDQFLLKGSFLFTVWNSSLIHRNTRDVDFLKLGTDEIEIVKGMLRSLCVMDVEKDGIIFDDKSIEVEPTRELEDYGGLKIRIQSLLGKARVPLHIDLGFGDIVTPGPEEYVLPTILDMPAPKLKTYPVYTVIAEKFEVIVERGLANTRMKDFFDLAFLIRKLELERAKVAQALKNTFGRRKTSLPVELPLGLTEKFYLDEDKQHQWKGFLMRNRIPMESNTLESTIKELQSFFKPILEAINLNSKKQT